MCYGRGLLSLLGPLFPFLLCSSSIKRNGKAAEPGGKIARSERKTKGGRIVPLNIEVEQEEDGRWLAEAPDLPGVLAYAQTRQEAIERVQVLSLRVLADRLEHGEPVPQMSGVFAVSP